MICIMLQKQQKHNKKTLTYPKHKRSVFSRTQEAFEETNPMKTQNTKRHIELADGRIIDVKRMPQRKLRAAIAAAERRTREEEAA